MRLIQPWADGEPGRTAVEAAVSALAGRQVTAVRYFYPRSALPPGYSCYPGFDLILKGVELSFGGRAAGLLWLMEGVREGLAVVEDPDPRFYASLRLRTAAAPEPSRWGPALSSAVTSAAVAWHLPDRDAPPALWSVRLGFQAGTSITIALGEPDGRGGLTYQPDSVVAIFDEGVARGYRIPASREPAWGTAVP